MEKNYSTYFVVHSSQGFCQLPDGEDGVVTAFLLLNHELHLQLHVVVHEHACSVIHFVAKKSKREIDEMQDGVRQRRR